MSTKTKTKNHALLQTTGGQISRSEISLTAVLSRLPNWVLAPTMVGVFGLLLTDLAVADPLPFVDEAALLWTLVSGMKVLGKRRRDRPVHIDLTDLEIDEGEPMDDVSHPAPGQPLRVPQG